VENGGGSDNEEASWSERKEIKTPYSETGCPIMWRCFSWAQITGDNWSAFQSYIQSQGKELLAGVVQSANASA